jgi:hypothetical protein
VLSLHALGDRSRAAPLASSLGGSNGRRDAVVVLRHRGRDYVHSHPSRPSWLNPDRSSATKPQPKDAPVAKLVPSKPIVLKAKAYATSDGRRSDTAEVQIPAGFKVDGQPKVRPFSKNGNVDIKPVKTEGKKVSVTVTAAGRKIFGSRNWIGVELIVTLKPDE